MLICASKPCRKTEIKSTRCDSWNATHWHSATGTPTSLHHAQALIYKPAEHEIRLFNQRLLVHNAVIMRVIHFTGSLRALEKEVRWAALAHSMGLFYMQCFTCSVYPPQKKNKSKRRQWQQCVKQGGDCWNRPSSGHTVVAQPQHMNPMRGWKALYPIISWRCKFHHHADTTVHALDECMKSTPWQSNWHLH